MKKLTISLPDDAEVDFVALSQVLSAAADIRYETGLPDASEVGCGRAGPEVIVPQDDPSPIFGQPPRKYYRRPDMSTLECVMRHFFQDGEVTRDTVARWLSQEGFSENSTSPALARLVSAGLMVRIGKGRWRFRKPAPEGVRLTSSLVEQMARQRETTPHPDQGVRLAVRSES